MKIQTTTDTCKWEWWKSTIPGNGVKSPDIHTVKCTVAAKVCKSHPSIKKEEKSSCVAFYTM